MFSVVVPVFNKLPHLERSINSVLNQSFPEFELILIDDASTDGSSDKIKEFSDPRIRILKRDIPGPGGYAARNLGIENSNYEWISFLDADDEWELNYLQEVKEVIVAHNSVKVVTGGWNSIQGNNNSERRDIFDPEEKSIEFTLIDYLKSHKYMWTSAVNIRKGIIKDAGMFPEGKCKRGGDVDLWIRCLNISTLNIHINEDLVNYYIDAVNRVSSNNNNPPENLYCLNTLSEIRNHSKNVEIVFAIDKYCAKRLWDKYSSRVNMGLPVNFYQLKFIHPFRNKIILLSKFLVKKLLVMYLPKSYKL